MECLLEIVVKRQPLRYYAWFWSILVTILTMTIYLFVGVSNISLLRFYYIISRCGKTGYPTRNRPIRCRFRLYRAEQKDSIPFGARKKSGQAQPYAGCGPVRARQIQCSKTTFLFVISSINAYFLWPIRCFCKYTAIV